MSIRDLFHLDVILLQLIIQQILEKAGYVSALKYFPLFFGNFILIKEISFIRDFYSKIKKVYVVSL